MSRVIGSWRDDRWLNPSLRPARGAEPLVLASTCPASYITWQPKCKWATSGAEFTSGNSPVVGKGLGHVQVHGGGRVVSGAVAVMVAGLHHCPGSGRGGGGCCRVVVPQDGRPGRGREPSWMIQLEGAPIHDTQVHAATTLHQHTRYSLFATRDSAVRLSSHTCGGERGHSAIDRGLLGVRPGLEWGRVNEGGVGRSRAWPSITWWGGRSRSLAPTPSPPGPPSPPIRDTPTRGVFAPSERWHYTM